MGSVRPSRKHHIDQRFARAGQQAIAPARAGRQEKPRPGHRLDAAAQRNLRLARLDESRSRHQAHHAGRTYHVECEPVHGVRYAGLHGRLARNELPMPGPQHITECIEIQGFPGDMRPFERSPHRGRSQIGRGTVFQRPAETSDGRSSGGNDIHVTHIASLSTY